MAVGEPAVQPSSQAELVAADAVKLSDGRLLFAFIQKGGALAQQERLPVGSKMDETWVRGFLGMALTFKPLKCLSRQFLE